MCVGDEKHNGDASCMLSAPGDHVAFFVQPVLSHARPGQLVHRDGLERASVE